MEELPLCKLLPNMAVKQSSVQQMRGCWHDALQVPLNCFLAQNLSFSSLSSCIITIKPESSIKGQRCEVYRKLMCTLPCSAQPNKKVGGRPSTCSDYFLFCMYPCMYVFIGLCTSPECWVTPTHKGCSGAGEEAPCRRACSTKDT